MGVTARGRSGVRMRWVTKVEKRSRPSRGWGQKDVGEPRVILRRVTKVEKMSPRPRPWRQKGVTPVGVTAPASN